MALFRLPPTREAEGHLKQALRVMRSQLRARYKWLMTQKENREALLLAIRERKITFEEAEKRLQRIKRHKGPRVLSFRDILVDYQIPRYRIPGLRGPGLPVGMVSSKEMVNLGKAEQAVLVVLSDRASKGLKTTIPELAKLSGIRYGSVHSSLDSLRRKGFQVKRHLAPTPRKPPHVFALAEGGPAKVHFVFPEKMKELREAAGLPEEFSPAEAKSFIRSIKGKTPHELHVKDQNKREFSILLLLEQKGVTFDMLRELGITKTQIREVVKRVRQTPRYPTGYAGYYKP
ncbi:hypothetical protein HY546_02105 [archaeon]|nr:hypothetical protein [archaeon]